ncbi:hypothetical protein LINGRAPRIM_LOCUS832 [Linum grandiflorum]
MISYCLFADDMVIFSKASIEEIDVIMSTISKYGEWTGKVVNTAKSSIFFSTNTPDVLKEAIRSPTCFEPDTSHDKYLGGTD